MRSILQIIVAAIGIVLFTSAAHAEGQSEGGQSTPVNAMCPIGKEPINKEAGTIEYKGKTVGFCCPSCAKEFMAWDESQRDAFILLAVAGQEPGHDAATPKPAGTDAKGAAPGVYPLDTCPVSGEKLGGMGDPVVKVYDGREVRFCCAMCVPRFEAAKDKYFAEIDAKIIAQQAPMYPLDTCPVSGEELGGMGETVDIVYDNRLVRFCCKMCVKKFKADPQAYFAILDKAVIAKQGEHYPLDVCVVSGEKLGGMGAPVDRVYAGHLVRFCCEMCIAKFEKTPSAYLAKIDEAWATQHAKGKH